VPSGTIIITFLTGFAGGAPANPDWAESRAAKSKAHEKDMRLI